MRARLIHLVGGWWLLKSPSREMARPSPRSPLFALLIAVLFAFTLGSDVERFNASRVGLIDLPDIPLDALPAFCLDFTSICALESAGNYESAFAWYEGSADANTNHHKPGRGPLE